VGPGGMVRDGECVAPGGSCALHARASGGECGGEVVMGRLECRACVSNGEDDELYCSPMFLESRYEGDVLVDLGFEFVFTSQVPT
jgi:hypothetical protein